MAKRTVIVAPVLEFDALEDRARLSPFCPPVGLQPMSIATASKALGTRRIWVKVDELAPTAFHN
jgi:hypothetical protein